jgi:hypothetical protein
MTGPGEYGELNVPYIIHTVGPNYHTFDEIDYPQADALLQSAYSHALDIAHQAQLEQIAFPLLSAGIYRGQRTLSQVLTLAVDALVAWGQQRMTPIGEDNTKDEKGLKEILIFAFTPREYKLLKQVCNQVFGVVDEDVDNSDAKDEETNNVSNAIVPSQLSETATSAMAQVEGLVRMDNDQSVPSLELKEDSKNGAIDKQVTKTTATTKKTSSGELDKKRLKISKEDDQDDTGTVDASYSIDIRLSRLQEIIGSDAGGRGMKNLIVDGDLAQASRLLAKLPPDSTTVILSGFPCCVTQNPPTETDGPPGTFAIARASVALGHRAVVVVDECNRKVFQACLDGLALPDDDTKSPELEAFPSRFSEEDEARFQKLVRECNLLIACERAGPAKDGVCYTMRGIDMNAAGLIAPLHRFVTETKVPFIAIGDGGNELGMGKVLSNIHKSIENADKIACVVPADHLIAAGVSNWGGYALALGAAICKAEELAATTTGADSGTLVASWVDKCLPTTQDETDLLSRAVSAGCRDGVSGEMEATVDGMPLERSLQCLRDLRMVAFGSATS